MNNVFIFLNLIFIIIICILNLLIYNKLNKYFKIIELKLENNISRTYSNNSNKSNDNISRTYSNNINKSNDNISRTYSNNSNKSNDSNDSNKNIICSDNIIYKKKYNKQNISSGTLFDTFNIKKNKIKNQN